MVTESHDSRNVTLKEIPLPRNIKKKHIRNHHATTHYSGCIFQEDLSDIDVICSQFQSFTLF